MKAAIVMAMAVSLAVSTAMAAEATKPAPMGDKGMSMQQMDKCEAMRADAKAGAKDAKDGNAMACSKDGMSDDHMKQMHEHMQQMHGDGDMMGKDGMGGMKQDGKSADARPKVTPKAADSAPADDANHEAHHPE